MSVMLLAEIDPSLVRLTYAHLAGIIACTAIVLTLIGCAFRFHTNEPWIPWAFTGCVAAWVVGHPALLGFARSFTSEFLQNHNGLFAYEEDGYSRLQRVGAALTTAAYAWLFCCRNGRDSYQRIALTLLLSGSLSFAISWMTGTIGYDGYNQGMLSGITFAEYYEISRGNSLLWRLNESDLPSWGEGVGWIIWYIGLFGAKPISPQAPDDRSDR